MAIARCQTGPFPSSKTPPAYSKQRAGSFRLESDWGAGGAGSGAGSGAGCGIRDNDPALRGFFLFQPACEDAVLPGSHIESRFYNLRLIHSEDSDSKLVVTLNGHYGREVFLFFRRATPSLSVSFFWRLISFCGSSCPSSFKDLAIAA